MNDFVPLAELLENTLPADGKGIGESAGDWPVAAAVRDRLAAVWRRQAQPIGQIGLHSQPLLFASGKLVVFAESAAWGNEIRHQTERLQRALAQHGFTITAIEVKTRPALFAAEG